jgi:hypothetical protein
MHTLKVPSNINKKKVLLIAAGVVVLVAIIAGLIYWLLQSTETDAKNSIKTSQSAVGKSLQAFNTKLASKDITPKGRLDAFTEFNQSLVSTDTDLCKNQKKSIVFAFSKAKQLCDASHEKLLSVKSATEKVETGIKDDQALSGVIAGAVAADATDPAKQVQAWTDSIANLQKLSVSPNATALKKDLATAATNYKNAWQSMIDVNTAQNKPGYEAATKTLQSTHDGVTAIAAKEIAALKTLLVEFRTATVEFQKQ